jgi:hypothetical protein
LPYNAVSATKGITVAVVSVTFSIDRTRTTWPEGATFSGKVTSDGAGVKATLYIQRKSPTTGEWFDQFGPITTDAEGNYSHTTSFGYGWACMRNTFRARVSSPAAAVSTEKNLDVAFPTRISISAPDKVAPGTPFTISGKLEYESGIDVWSGLAGKTVSLYYNGTKIADVTTGSDGSYSKTDAVIPTSGTYTLKASYAGEGWTMAAFALFGVEVGVPPELEPLAQYASYALAAVPVLAIGGVIAYNEFAKRR